jgi:hypothetical protein
MEELMFPCRCSAVLDPVMVRTAYISFCPEFVESLVEPKFE